MPPTQQNPWASFSGGVPPSMPPMPQAQNMPSWWPQPGQWGSQNMGGMVNPNIQETLGMGTGGLPKELPRTINHPQYGQMFSTGLPGGSYQQMLPASPGFRDVVGYSVTPEQAYRAGVFGQPITWGQQAEMAALNDYWADMMTNRFNFDRANQVAANLASSGGRYANDMMALAQQHTEQGMAGAREQARQAYDQTLAFADETRKGFQDTRAESIAAARAEHEWSMGQAKEDLARQSTGNSTAFQMTDAEWRDRSGKLEAGGTVAWGKLAADMNERFAQAQTNMNMALNQFETQAAWKASDAVMAADQYYSNYSTSALGAAAQLGMRGEENAAQMVMNNPFSMTSQLSLVLAMKNVNPKQGRPIGAWT